MIDKWLFLVILTFLPFVELRLSIPVGILNGTVPLFFGLSVSGLALNPLVVYFTATITNILLGFGIYELLVVLDKHLRRSPINYRYTQFLDTARRSLSPYVKKYGIYGVALFIALPIPGSGVYIGSVGSHVLGLSRKDFRYACVLGVIIAASLVTLLTLTSQSIFG